MKLEQSAEKAYKKAFKEWADNPEDMRTEEQVYIDLLVSFAKENNIRSKKIYNIKSTEDDITREIFKSIVSIEKWYEGIMSPAAASMFKKRFLAGKVSEKKIERIFNRFGYVKKPVEWIDATDKNTFRKAS